MNNAEKAVLAIGAVGGGAALLYMLARPKTEAMLRRVGILGVDESKSFKVTAIGEALARISNLKVACKQLDGTMAVFDILAGQVPSAVPGDGNLVFRKGVPSDIGVTNNGIKGTVWMRLLDDTGAQIYSAAWNNVEAGQTVYHPVDFVVTMPKRDYVLTVEVGH